MSTNFSGSDVTHFVSPGSALDDEARERATSVYLTQRVIPMLPRPLCEELCSLKPGEDRLAFRCAAWRGKGALQHWRHARFFISPLPPSPLFALNSTIWDLDAKGRILSEWMGRSVIRTASQLTYGTRRDR